MPRKVLNLRSKAFASFTGKPATHEEVYEYVCQAEELNSYEKFEDYVDNGRKSDPGDIRFARLGKFLSRNAKDARKLVTLFFERRNRQMNKEVNTKNWNFFMDAAWQSVCVCPVALGLGLANDLLGSVNWHDSTERLRKNRKETIGKFAKYLYFNNFADRKENLFTIGTKGSGETAVLSAFRNISPEVRVFTPIYDSGAPFAKLRERHILGNFQEFRCRTTIAASTSLVDGTSAQPLG